MKNKGDKITHMRRQLENSYKKERLMWKTKISNKKERLMGKTTEISICLFDPYTHTLTLSFTCRSISISAHKHMHRHRRNSKTESPKQQNNITKNITTFIFWKVAQAIHSEIPTNQFKSIRSAEYHKVKELVQKSVSMWGN